MKIAMNDHEIMAWNDRLEYLKLGIMVNPIYNNQSSFPAIGFTTIASIYEPKSWGKNINTFDSPVLCPEIKYDFTFSILKQKKELFDTIYNIIKETKLDNLVSHGKEYRNLDIENNMNKELTCTEHSLYGKDYVRYTYLLEGALPEIMAYVKFINDAINYTLIEPKFKPNNIVSLNNDKSRDFLIIDYKYEKINFDYKLYYILKEILTEKPEVFLKYANTDYNIGFCEEDLCYSRNDRINQIIS